MEHYIEVTRRGELEALLALAPLDTLILLANENGWTLLQEAVGEGHRHMVEVFLNAGASVHTLDEDGETLLHLAVSEHHADVVRLLLQRGAKLNIKDTQGATPLISLCRNTEPIGQTALHKQMDRLAMLNTLDALLEAEALLDIKDDIEMTALMWAAWSGDLQIVQRLIRAGASRKIKDDVGRSAADIARQQGFFPVARYLHRTRKRRLGR